jgi:S-adenosylmethionine synthetase
MHFSAPEPYTKYEIVLLFASIMGLPHQHVIADDTDPNTKGETTRPRDCKLDTYETEVLLDGVPGGVLGCAGFEEWWRTKLTEKKQV